MTWYAWPIYMYGYCIYTCCDAILPRKTCSTPRGNQVFGRISQTMDMFERTRKEKKSYFIKQTNKKIDLPAVGYKLPVIISKLQGLGSVPSMIYRCGFRGQRWSAQLDGFSPTAFGTTDWISAHWRPQH